MKRCCGNTWYLFGKDYRSFGFCRHCGYEGMYTYCKDCLNAGWWGIYWILYLFGRELRGNAGRWDDIRFCCYCAYEASSYNCPRCLDNGWWVID